MLKSSVKICDMTKRRMPLSFMVRFVNASFSEHEDHVEAANKVPGNFIPNLTSNNKTHKYNFIYACPELFSFCKKSNFLSRSLSTDDKKYTPNRIRERFYLEFVSAFGRIPCRKG